MSLELKMKILGRDVKVKLSKVAKTMDSYGKFVTRDRQASWQRRARTRRAT